MRRVRWSSVCTAVLVVVSCASGCTHKRTLELRTPSAELLTPRRKPPQSPQSARPGGSRVYVPIPPRQPRAAEPGAASTIGTENAPLEPTPLGTTGGWSVSISTLPNADHAPHPASPAHQLPAAAADRNTGRVWSWGLIAIVVIAAAAAAVYLRRRASIPRAGS